MPTYIYEVILPDGGSGQMFEAEQPMSDPPLTKHPTTGQPVRRVVTAPNLNISHSSAKEKALLSDNNLGKMGFTKYVKTDQGKYERTVGKGPDRISSD